MIPFSNLNTIHKPEHLLGLASNVRLVYATQAAVSFYCIEETEIILLKVDLLRVISNGQDGNFPVVTNKTTQHQEGRWSRTAKGTV